MTERPIIDALPADAHARPATAVLDALSVAPAAGLSGAEAAARLGRFGPNRLAERRAVPALEILVRQFASPVVWLLSAAAALSFLYGELVEGLAIVAVLALNGAIGFATEFRAIRSMEALRRLGRVAARVRRDGAARPVAAEELVPGDIVLVEGGDVIAADLRLVEASKIEADESALTGESVPVAKGIAAVAADAPVTERTPILFKGTAVTRGAGLGVVVGTGMATELGRISALVAEARPEASPLERQLDRLAGHLIWVTLALCVVIAGIGIATGKSWVLMVEAAIALAVAAIPEGLPVVATMALARGMWRMARRNALVERLSAVETLGATTLILTDKTGTLTENRLSVARILAAGAERDLLAVAALCNNAELETDGRPASGDPIEVALLRAAAEAGLSRSALAVEYPRHSGAAFDSETAMMATVHHDGPCHLTCVKGAPEAVLDHCTQLAGPEGAQPLDDEQRRAWLAHTHALAGDGLRVLGLAWKRDADADGAPYRGLTFLGLAGLIDPPRADVAPAIGDCRRAGIRVVMLTGDHAVTARRVAEAIGLTDHPASVVEGRDIGDPEGRTDAARARLLAADVLARVTPAQKLDLVGLHQKAGAVVAMTGDGVNDAPALKKADIGVAMGQRGTQVAREAAAMVLTDDAFPTIVHAVREGRVIFRNIQRFVAYLLSCNLSEILVVGLAVLSGLPLPLLPLQILFLNLVTDVFPAFALGVGAGDDGVLDRPPRDPSKPILTRAVWGLILPVALAITAATLAAFLIARHFLELDATGAVTISFLTLAFAQLWNVFNMHDPRTPLVRGDIPRNPYVWAALGGCGGLLLLVTYVPPLAALLSLRPPGLAGWMVIIGLSLAPVAVGLAGKAALARVAGWRQERSSAREERNRA